MTLRKILAGLVSFILVAPAWGAGEPVGSITASSDATVRSTALTPGSTVFNGDTIAVDARGGARMALSGGSQAEILGDSSVRLTKADNKIQMIVDRGQASFHTSKSNQLSARVLDSTVRPASDGDTLAIIQTLSPTHAVVAAEKGTLLVTTAYNGKAYTVPEGKAADIAVSADPQPQQGGTPVPAGRSSTTISPPSSHTVLIVTLVVVGAGVIVAAYYLAKHETNLPTSTLQNEISPATLH